MAYLVPDFKTGSFSVIMLDGIFCIKIEAASGSRASFSWSLPIPA